MGRPRARVNTARWRHTPTPAAVLVILVFMSAEAPLPTVAASPTSPGHEASIAKQRMADRSVWDGVYTSDQASRGRSSYREECTICHLEDLLGDGMAPALVGNPFRLQWDGRSVGDLYAAIRATMPQGAPFILSPQAYVDIVAFLLSRNEYPSSEEELRPDGPMLDEIVIEAERPR